jgi:hypothetical protein
MLSFEIGRRREFEEEERRVRRKKKRGRKKEEAIEEMKKKEKEWKLFVLFCWLEKESVSVGCVSPRLMLEIRLFVWFGLLGWEWIRVWEKMNYYYKLFFILLFSE